MKPALPKGPSVKLARHIIAKHPHKGWADLSLAYGKNFLFQGNLFTADAELVRSLLMDRQHTQHRSAVYKFMSWLIPGAPGILFMDGDKWQRRIQAAMPVFTKANVDSYAQTIHETVQAELAGWKNGMVLDDLYLSITEIGWRVVLKVGYGLDPANPLSAAYGKALMEYKLLTMTSNTRIDVLGFSADQLLLIPALYKNIRVLKQQMRRQQHLLQQIIAQRNSANVAEMNWIDLFLQAGFNIKEMTDELNHVYGAFNAIDYTISCGLYQLSKQPALLQRIQQELRQVIGKHRHPVRDDLALLPQTANFIKEVYRYYPVAIAVMRKTGKPLQVNHASYPAGKEVIIALQSMHYHPDYWEDPVVFNPDRWNAPLKEPLAYIPFLQGPRQCIGKHLAELHFLVTLNAILQHASIETLAPMHIGNHIIPRFEKPIPARIHLNEPK